MTLKVNGEVIPERELERERRRLIKAYSAAIPVEAAARQIERIKTQAKDLVIGRKLLLAEAARQGVEVSPVEMEEAVDGLRKALGTQAAFQAHLAKLGMSLEELRNFIHAAQKIERLVKQVVADAAEPGAGEITSYYESHPVEFALPERVRVGQILVKCGPADAGGRELARARALDLKAQLLAGADFSELAARNSDDPRAKNSGGDLGFITRGMLPPPLEEAVFNLKTGEVSDPIETGSGYHLLLKREHHPAGLRPFDQVKDQIRVALRTIMENKALLDFVGRLRKQARIEDDEVESAQRGERPA